MVRTIPARESLTVEFKSDRKRLPDVELVSAIVCLANTDGGEIFLGVENDGAITGVHPDHQNVTGLAALVANRTIPPIGVRVSMLHEAGTSVARIEVPRSLRLVATSDGLLQRRRLQADGTPECVPFYPHEFAGRQADLGFLDYSALPIAGASLADFDPLERVRLRSFIERYRGDQSLLTLSDDDLDGALGLTRHAGGVRTPTVTGLLLLGTEAGLREHLPTHETAFQLLDDTAVRVNEFSRAPLLKSFERLYDQFSSRVIEDELQVGLFRVPIPNYDSRAFREALVNALVHRDYTRLGTVFVRWEQERITISNPGGFVEGVTLDNLLVIEPRPRNPVLADAIKRIGLAERTGRGVDLIYQGLLRYGRPAPDYGRSNATAVVIRLLGDEADKGLLRAIIDEEHRTSNTLPVESLIILQQLRHERRVTAATIARAVQRDEGAARGILERLVETGMIEAHGGRNSREYTFSAAIYRQLGQTHDYVRQTAFAAIQQEQMVRRYIEVHGQITRKETITLCRVSEDQASRLLARLVKTGVLRRTGRTAATIYRPTASQA